MRNLMLTTALISLAMPAFAAKWTVDPTKSSLTFSGKQTDETFKGSFKKFTPEIDFDEAHPETSHIHITVDMASVTVEGKDRNDALPSDDWFGVKKFPAAEFTSTKITKTGEHQFEAAGNLTLHGVSQPLTLPFTLAPNGTATKAEGAATLSRKDFGIGQGRWASDQWIAYPVSVDYVIVATPAK